MFFHYSFLDSECLNIECSGFAIDNGAQIHETANLTVELTDQNGKFVDDCDLKVILRDPKDDSW